MKPVKLSTHCIDQKQSQKSIRQFNLINEDFMKMVTIFINSENSKISDPHRLLLNLEDKITLRGNNKYVALLHLNFYIHGKH